MSIFTQNKSLKILLVVFWLFDSLTLLDVTECQGLNLHHNSYNIYCKVTVSFEFVAAFFIFSLLVDNGHTVCSKS